MRFACIEYTTKTGAVWRPTPERPNYLADPLREIDPTSFGCYTSALNGEHLPLSSLLYGSAPQAPTKKQRFLQDLQRKMRGTFRRYPLRYLSAFDVLLVIYQLSNDREVVDFVQRVREEFPETILVSSSSPPFGRLREYWRTHPETIEKYHTFLQATHFNMNVCRATVPFYQQFSTTPSLYLPQPYPVEYAMQRAANSVQRAETVVRQAKSDAPSGFVPPLRRDALSPQARKARGADEPVIYVAGDTVRPDIMTGHLVANVLQQRHPELLIRITKTPEFSLNTSLLQGSRFEVVPFRLWAEQLQELSRTRLVINTDLWWTRGRVQVDGAAAGVPCVGTTSDGQSELWPELTAPESVHVDELIALGERALSDEAFRVHTVARAQRRLLEYAYAPATERFQKALELAREGRLSDWQDPVWVDDTLVFPSP